MRKKRKENAIITDTTTTIINHNVCVCVKERERKKLHTGQVQMAQVMPGLHGMSY